MANPIFSNRIRSVAKVKPVSPPNPARIPTDRTAAVEWLMQEYGTRVLHLAYFYLKDRHLAEDVAQEVFIKAYRNWDSFRGESSPYTWLHRIAVNLCRDKARSAWWRRLLPSEDLRTGGRQELDLFSPGADPEESAIRSDQQSFVLQHVLALPQPYREVIFLYYYEDLSTAEIAALTGQNENTIKTRLFRARASLKKMLSQGGEER